MPAAMHEVVFCLLMTHILNTASPEFRGCRQLSEEDFLNFAMLCERFCVLLSVVLKLLLVGRNRDMDTDGRGHPWPTTCNHPGTLLVAASISEQCSLVLSAFQELGLEPPSDEDRHIRAVPAFRMIE
jgi:hypothetical protein